MAVGGEDLTLVIGDHLRAAGYATLRGIGIKEVIDAQGYSSFFSCSRSCWKYSRAAWGCAVEC